MPLPIRDGNQSLTTLSTILVSNAHIPAHTVISFGTQGITDIATAVSGVELGPNTLNALENITVTLGQVTITGGLTDAQLRASAVTIGGGIYLSDAQVVIGGSAPPEAIQIGGYNLADNKLYPIHVDDLGVQTIKGAVTASISGTASVTFGTAVVTGSTSILNFPATQAVTFTQASVTFSQAPVTFGTAVITGSTSIIGTPSVTFTQIATHGVIIGAGTAQIGSVTASISGTPSVTFTTASVTFGTSVITGSVSILNIPATQTVTFTQASVTFGTAVITGSTSILGTATITGSTSILNFPATQAVSIASVTIGNTVTIANIQGTSVTTSNFTSTTPSTVLAGFNATREVLTIFNEGAGNLHISVGTTCTTLSYQVRLSAGDYYEAPLNQASITHSAVFATAGTARVAQVS